MRLSAERLQNAARTGGPREVTEMAEQAEELNRWQRARKAGQARPFDQPDGAQAFYVLKRLPQDQNALNGLTLVAAEQAAASMGVYSTARHAFVTSTRRREAMIDGHNLPGTWAALGPGNVGGRTRAILIHPTTPTTMWAGGVAGGIWKTTDGGANWVPKADLAVNIAVNSLILDPRNPNHLYAGTGEGFFNADAVRGAGILQSLDGGETWANLPSTATSDFYYVQKMVMSKGSSQRLYAATRTGVFRTIDGGNTWGKVLDCSGVNGAMDLAIQTDRPLAMVFAACGTFLSNGSTQAAVYRALDTAGTMTWKPVLNPTNMGRTSLAIAPSNQNILYALSASNESGNYNQGLLGVYKSVNSGATWTTQVTNTDSTTQNTLLLTNPVYAALTSCGFGTSAFYTQGWYDNIIAVDPVDPTKVWAGGIDLFRSDDSGQNWGLASFWWATPGSDPEYSHADQHTIVFHPGYNGTSNQVMFVGSDGGVFQTGNARASVYYSPNPITSGSAICGNVDPANDVHWTALNNGYAVTQFYHGVPYPDNNTFFGGTQDNGTPRGTTGGGPNAWSSVLGGDGGFVAVNPSNTNIVFAENTSISLKRSTNGGASFGTFTSGITEASGNFLFITPFAQDPNTPGNMWIGGAYLWQTSQGASATPTSPIWTRASAFLGQRVSAIAVAPGDSNTVIVGGQTGSVWRNSAALSATSTTTWASSKPRPDSNYISWVTIDPTNTAIVYATVSTYNSGSGQGHVFKSTDGGVTWTNIGGSGATGIPDVPAHCILADPTNTNILYLATDIGVFVTLDGGATWDRENTGFANVTVESLAINGNYLYAFTHGRSAWRVAIH